MAFSDQISIRGLQVDCVVGVYASERDLLQPLVLDVDLTLDTERAATSGRISHTVDYDALSSQLAFVLQSCRFGLLETAAHALARYLLAPPAPDERRAPIVKARLRLVKPAALRGGAVASVGIEREASWVKMKQESKAFGTVDVVFETSDAGMYRLNVYPGKSIPLHVHQVMQESEMVLGDGLLCQGRPVAPGTVHRWPHGAAHTYENPTDRVLTILCVDRPRFIEEDEVPVQGEPAAVAPEPGYPR
ncbi:MAG TPA: dihydroneopterin aldolase [Polyangiaceae bacterium]|nr:dihydroneopterin aldolase [Polyangiaceae bacterium]